MKGQEAIIRPSAILPEAAAVAVVTALKAHDVSQGGVWNATPGIWQLYDTPWNGRAGTRGTSMLVGTIAAAYDQPRRHEITIYKATLTDEAIDAGWTPEQLCDQALAFAGLTLASCPRASLADPPPRDPFRRVEPPPASARELLYSDVTEVLRTDVRELVKLLVAGNPKPTPPAVAPPPLGATPPPPPAPPPAP